MTVLRSKALLVLLLLIVSSSAVAGYLLLAYSSGYVGYPLDDAWIHQTYALNLAQNGQLAYLPGEPSAGSTSPAWAFLLSVGHLLGLDHRLWSYLLGSLSLAATAWLVYRLLLRLPPLRPHQRLDSKRDPGQPVAALLAGLFCAVEWHLVWAAASGMETLLFTALSLALLEYYFSQIAHRRAPKGPASLQTEQLIVGSVGIGLLAGLLAVTRPEGLILAGLVILALFFFPWPAARSELRSRLLATGASLLALGLFLVPYAIFNLRAGGAMFPNTFYAKQAEYQVQGFLLVRMWKVLFPTLVGAQVLLIPGFCYAVLRLVRERHWPELLPFVWWLAFLAVYAWRLPVTYQHGRYTMPSIPLLVLYGIWGTAQLLQPRSSHILVRVFSRATPVAVVLLAILFWGRGALAYRDDVGFVENEMVAMARWLNEHTTTADLLAVHDIGAVGYQTDRKLLDLAGLISPEVIPFISDANQLANWMLERNADYAIFFPDFSHTYGQLAEDPRLTVVYCTDYAWTRSQGHENMCVYRLVTED
jgi:hypothetical protein